MSKTPGRRRPRRIRVVRPATLADIQAIAHAAGQQIADTIMRLRAAPTEERP